MLTVLLTLTIAHGAPPVAARARDDQGHPVVLYADHTWARADLDLAECWTLFRGPSVSNNVRLWSDAQLRERVPLSAGDGSAVAEIQVMHMGGVDLPTIGLYATGSVACERDEEVRVELLFADGSRAALADASCPLGGWYSARFASAQSPDLRGLATRDLRSVRLWTSHGAADFSPTAEDAKLIRAAVACLMPTP